MGFYVAENIRLSNIFLRSRFVSLRSMIAFTLAEVLIVLGILGIIAEVTIPSVIQSIQNTELKMAWRKNYSTISQVYQQIISENNYKFSGLCSDTDFNCFRDLFKAKLRYNTSCDSNDSQGKCWHNDNEFYTSLGAPRSWYPAYSGLILANGALVSFNFFSKDCDVVFDLTAGTSCGTIYVDVNGFAKPNRVGRDLFYIFVTNNKIAPSGSANYTRSGASNACTPSTMYQWDCSYSYLYN